MIKVTPKCKESLFGCCKDNYSPSKGFNYEGCPEYCDCDPYGAYSDLCDDSGQCLCKPGVTGKRCNVCKPHFWGFEKSVYFTGCKRKFGLLKSYVFSFTHCYFPPIFKIRKINDSTRFFTLTCKFKRSEC